MPLPHHAFFNLERFVFRLTDSTQVAYGSKQWRATKRKERDEEDAAAAAALLDETPDTPPLPLTNTPMMADDPTGNGRQKSRVVKSSKSRLPRAMIESGGEELRDGGGQAGTGTGAGSRAISLMGGKLSKLNLGFTKKSTSKGKP